jgi:ankyrin repeat protein
VLAAAAAVAGGAAATAVLAVAKSHGLGRLGRASSKLPPGLAIAAAGMTAVVAAAAASALRAPALGSFVRSIPRGLRFICPWHRQQQSSGKAASGAATGAAGEGSGGEESCGVELLDQTDSSPLHLAALFGSEDAVREILSQGSLGRKAAAVRDGCGRTPLHGAAIRGDKGVVCLLAAACSSSVNAKDKEGRTPLHHAVLWGHYEAARSLLALRADPCVCDALMRTPLHYAASRGEVELVDLLFRKGSAAIDLVDGSGLVALTAALVKGHAAAAQRIAAERQFEAYALTPLQAAAQAGNVQAVSALLAARARVHETGDSSNKTPLALAAAGGHGEVVEMLLRAGAEVNRPTKEPEEKPLHCAAAGGHVGVVQRLIAAGADVSKKVENHPWAYYHGLPVGPLAAAALGGHVEVVRVLLAAGVSLEIRDADTEEALAQGRSPRLDYCGTLLHCAVKHRKFPVLQVLLDAGADVDSRDRVGNTALHRAALGEGRGSLDAVKLLIEAGADVNAVGLGQNTPLHVAVRSGNPAVVRALLEAGADVAVVDNYGRSPLAAAVSANRSRAAAEVLVACAEKILRSPAAGVVAIGDWDAEEAAFTKSVVRYLQKEGETLGPQVQQLRSVRSNLARLLCWCGCAEGFKKGERGGGAGLSLVGPMYIQMAAEVAQLRQDVVRLAGITPSMQEAIVCVAKAHVGGGCLARSTT